MIFHCGNCEQMVNAMVLSKSTQSYANYFLRCDITRDLDRVKNHDAPSYFGSDQLAPPTDVDRTLRTIDECSCLA